MTPAHFPEANMRFGPPPGIAESQVAPIVGHVRQIQSGSCDGAMLAVVAWKPTEAEIAHLAQGGLIYLSCLGGVLPPHFISTTFEEAVNPA